jgi:hypothetical protein
VRERRRWPPFYRREGQQPLFMVVVSSLFMVVVTTLFMER